MDDLVMMQLQERLDLAHLTMSSDEFEQYYAMPEEMEGAEVPKGYKKCNKCDKIKKLPLFNKNSSAKDGCTSQCKDCQKQNAHKSYAKNKHKKTYKSYYQKHKEAKREQSRKYYQEHKEELAKKHAAYRATTKGKRAMNKAHSKRAKSLKKNTGIPYTREMVIERDSHGGTEPICYLCGKPIHGTPHLDHVIPVVMGGLDCFTNIACVHDICNLSKSKDAREITDEQVNALMRLSDEYIDQHRDKFPALFGDEDSADEANN